MELTYRGVSYRPESVNRSTFAKRINHASVSLCYRGVHYVKRLVWLNGFKFEVDPQKNIFAGVDKY